MTSATRRTLAVTVRAPIPGKVNARLCPPLDPATAARLYQAFVLDTAKKASSTPDAETVVCYTPADSVFPMPEIAPGATRYMLLDGMHIGERLSSCFRQLAEPGTAVVCIGATAPTMPARCLELAFDALASGEVDIVLGPTLSGGFYLLGMREHHPEFLRDILWSTLRVRERAVERAAELGLGWYLLPEWYSVDTPPDLAHLKAELLDRSVITPSAYYTRKCLENLTL